MTKAVILTNIPAPYRVDLFKYLQTNQNIEYSVIFTSLNEDNRQWQPNISNLSDAYVLKSRILKFRKDGDFKYVHVPKGLVHLLNRLHPDVIIGWEYNPSALAALAWAKMHRIKFIHLTDGTLNSERSLNVVQRLSRYLMIRGSNAYLASSRASKMKLEKWGASSSKILISLLTENLAPYKLCAPKLEQSRPAKLLFVGSIIDRKGIDVLLESMSLVKTNVHLNIVGNNNTNEANRYLRKSEKLNLQDRVTWVGYKSGTDLLQEYQTADALIVPSKIDCFGLVVLEGIASGTPVITSQYVDGAKDIIENGLNGIIVENYSAKAFSSAIEYLFDERRSVNFAKKCRLDLDKFDFGEVSKSYKKAIDLAMG